MSEWLVHNQIYGFNDFYVGEMSRQYGRGMPFLAPAFRTVARRLIVAQTFLHSDHCARISLKPIKGDRQRRLSAKIVHAPGQSEAFDRARTSLRRFLRRAGLIFVPVGGRSGAHGSSFHTGATIPMVRDPGPGESDILGRPKGYSRVHVVDSSVMPAIPASTITFSVMANAHRIASADPG